MSAKPGEFQPVAVVERMPQSTPLTGRARVAAYAAAACMRRAASMEPNAETADALRRAADAVSAPREGVSPDEHAAFEAGRATAEADMVAFLDAELAHIERRNISDMVPRGDEVAEMRRAILTGRYERTS